MEAQQGRDAKAKGDVGELQFELWAREERMAVTRVEYDEHGWDYLVELPRGYVSDGNISLDLVPCEVRCFVQVKTVTKADGRVQIALSNWHRMVNDPAPWFIAIMVLNGKRVSEAYLVHVDEGWCSRVLKRLRALPESESQNLHNHYLEVAWKQEERLPELDGVSVEAAIRLYAGSDLSAYTKRKQSWLNTVGYDKQPHHVEFTIEAKDAEEAKRIMSEFALGVRDKLPLSSLKAEEERFGIRKLIHESAGDGAYIEIQDRKPDFSTIVTFEPLDRSGAVELWCDSFVAASVMPGLPDDMPRVRFATKLFSVTLCLGPSSNGEEDQMTMSFECHFVTPPDDEKLSLRELGNTARALLLLHDSFAEPIRMKVSNGTSTFKRDDVRANLGIDPEALEYWRTIDRAVRIAEHFDIATSTSVQAKSLVDQYRGLEFLASCTIGPTSTVNFGLVVTLPAPPEAESVALLYAPYVVIGPHVVGFFVAFVGTPSWSSEGDGRTRLKVEGATMRIMRELCLSEAEWQQLDMDNEYDSLRATLQADGVPLAISAMEMSQSIAQA